MDTAVAILALGPSGKLPLDHLKGLRVDDGLVVILHVVLRDLTLIGFHLLGQEVLAEGFLQQGVSLVLLVREDALDGGQGVNRVPRKAADGLGDDQVDLAVQCISDNRRETGSLMI